MTIDRYSPSEIEQKWYEHWMAQNLFAPSLEKGKPPFCIVIPPPNVTGSLHMGHAWDNTIQDVLIRWKRMCGDNTLWIPGTDHAGIATQWMVEKALRDRGVTKEELGRKAFEEEAWKFKEAAHGTIVGQLRRLGVSCDWGRERFTLDAGLSRAVRRVFANLYREGLIYRDNRMVSWCPRCLTALSDLEVNHKEHDAFLYHFRYPLIGREGHVSIATTRPETMLGDGAVAVNENDERYRDMIGAKVMLPLVHREIPIVADPYPDPEFGSGAVKVTAAHDPNDFEMGRRHNVPLYIIMGKDGRMNQEVPAAYRNRDRFEVREMVLADLEKEGLMEKTERHVHSVGHCSRCDTVIEPMVSLQWFAKMGEMAQAAVTAVQEKRIELLPEFQEKIFFEWMNNIQDWCISRQLWWGHRIPVWYCQSCQEVIVSEEETVTACPACGSGELEMEQDVLDTWFSSGLWPFSTMGWPENTEDLETFYPTSVLVTGYDILFFWVARMAMLGIKFMDNIPFHQVLLHGLLRDQNGEKMSKTKGNGLDPLDMIGEYGADALRFTLAAGTVLGRDMVLQRSTIEGYRNFINKIWNATRFTLGHLEKLGEPPGLSAVTSGPFDRWIQCRLNLVSTEINEFMEQRRFNEAARVVYQFVWHELCDWYVEISKPMLLGELGEAPQAATLATLLAVLRESLALLHPFMPFVTEELWHALPGAEGSIMVHRYPAGGGESGPALEPEVEMWIEVVQQVRALRGENGVRPRRKVDVVVVLPPGPLHGLLESEQLVFSTLADVKELELTGNFPSREGYAHGVGNGFEVFLSLAGVIDVAQEKLRIGKEVERTEGKIHQIEAKLGNPHFTGKAPAAVVEKNRGELSDLQAQLEKLHESLSQLPSA